MPKKEKDKKQVQTIKVDTTKPESNLKSLGGSRYDEFNNILANQAIATISVHNHDPQYASDKKLSALQAMGGIAPQNEVEGMLGAQMVACHNAIMECYRRAASSSLTIEQGQFNLGFANKLSRTFTMQMDALQRFRGQGGQQKVEVTHLHVHEGGQAIVAGNIERPSLKGVGVQEKAEEQPHAKQDSTKQITHAPEPAMPCFDTAKDPVPVPRDA